MKRRLLAFGSLAIGLASMALALVTLLPGEETQAADHLDSPLSQSNVALDINDVYAFRPATTDDLCVIVTVNRFTGNTTQPAFDNNGLYQIFVDNTGDNTPEATVTFDFDGTSPQTYTVTGLGAPITGNVSDFGTTVIGGGGGIQIYAGPRDDPFFFDLVGFQNFMANLGTTGVPPYTPNSGLRNTGVNGSPVNFFAGGNTLAIALQLPIVAVNGTSPADPNSGTIRAWAKTIRQD
jgi:hypothetical protein